MNTIPGTPELEVYNSENDSGWDTTPDTSSGGVPLLTTPNGDLIFHATALISALEFEKAVAEPSPKLPAQSGFDDVEVEDLLPALGQLQILPKRSSSLAYRPPKLQRRKVVIHCVRHAEAHHNLLGSRNNPNFNLEKAQAVDAELTPNGTIQAQLLAKHFKPMNKITFLVCSPMRRTTSTAMAGFQALAGRNIKLVAWPDLREGGKSRWNRGSPLPTLELLASIVNQVPGTLNLDLSMVKDNWEYDQTKAKERAETVRHGLWELGQALMSTDRGKWKGLDLPPCQDPEKDIEILVISHGKFLKYLEEADESTYYNTMHKSYEFASVEMIQAGASPWKLVETTESEKRVSAFCAEHKKRRIETRMVNALQIFVPEDEKDATGSRCKEEKAVMTFFPKLENISPAVEHYRDSAGGSDGGVAVSHEAYFSVKNGFHCHKTSIQNKL